MGNLREFGQGGVVAALTLGLFCTFYACGSDDSSGLEGSGGGAASTGSGGTAASGADGGIFIEGGDGFPGSGGSGGINQCAETTSVAEQIVLDMYIMHDKSGSMSLQAAGGTTKWDATRAALTNFVNDPQSAGLGVGIQYFPLRMPGVPATCTNNSQCGAGGPCLLRTCSNVTTTLIPCATNADCPGATCIPFGICSQTPDIACLPVGGNCSNPGAGACQPITQSTCVGATLCNADGYGTPAVAIDTLPGAAGAIVASINAQQPDGNTPTAPALQGAIDHATSWAQANPSHRVVVVMATDGLPTECTPLAIGPIAQIAADGFAGTPSISTFVIGVFAPSETQAAGNLDAIASSGGTNNAFIIDTTQNVTQQFLQALNAIRGTALACEYVIPDPPQGETLDYNKVNVDFTQGGQTTTIFFVDGASECDPAAGGWYYDDPQAPTKIMVCPATCDLFTSTTDGQVDIRMGCESNVMPPR